MTNLVPKLRVEHYPKEGEESWSTTATVLNASKVSVDQVTGKKTDKADLTFEADATINVQAGDRFKIYMGTGTAFPANTDLVIDAVSKETNYSSSRAGIRWRIVGEDRSRLLLSNMLQANYEIGDAKDTSSDIIQDFLASTQDNVNSELLKVYWYDASSPDAKGTAANGVTTKQLNYFKDFTPVLEMIQELSNPEYSGDGFFYYYVEYDPLNDKNYFYWRQRTDADAVSLSEGEWEELTFQHQTYDLVNALIVNTGSDPDFGGMKTIAIDASSMIAHGAQWKYEPMNDISKNFLDAQRASAGWTAAASSRYPDPGDYPYTSAVPTTTTFENAHGSSPWSPGSFPISTTDAQFKLFMRHECKAQGKQKGNDLIAFRSQPTYRFKTKLTGAEFQSSFTKGGVVNLTFNNNVIRKNYVNTNTILVRVHGIQHSFSKTGWVINLDLREDEPGVDS